MGILDVLRDAGLLDAMSNKNSVPQRITDLTNQFSRNTQANYNPWIQTGDQAAGQAESMRQAMLGMETPEAQVRQNNLIRQLMEQNQNQQIPEAVKAVRPTGPDYQAARNSNMFRQMQDQTMRNATNSAALGGASARGGNTNYNIATGARNNLVNSANQIYQNDLANYNNAMSQNQLRNSMLTNQFGNQMNLQKLLNNNQLMNYQNQMKQYGLDQQQIRDNLTQLNHGANQGFTDLNTFQNLYNNLLNSQIGSLNSISAAQQARQAGKAQIKGAADARKSQGLSTIGTIAGSAFGGPIGGAIGGAAGGMLGSLF